MAGLAIQLAIRLRQRHQLQRALPLVERQDALLLRQLQIRRNLRGHRGPIRLFLCQLRVQYRRRRATAALALLPPLGGIEVDQRHRNLFGRAAPLRTDIPHHLADDLVAHHNLIATILQDQPRAVWRRVRGRRQQLLLGGRQDA